MLFLTFALSPLPKKKILFYIGGPSNKSFLAPSLKKRPPAHTEKRSFYTYKVGDERIKPYMGENGTYTTGHDLIGVKFLHIT